MDNLIKVKGAIKGSDDATGNHEEPPSPSQLSAEDTDGMIVACIPLHTHHAEHEDEEPQDPSQLPPPTHNGDDEMSLDPFRDSSLPPSDDDDKGGESEAAALLNLDQEDEDVDATTYCQQMKAHFDEHKDKEQFPEIWEDVYKHALLHLTDTTDLKPAPVHNLIMKV
ncbi:hypothetical protein PAXRUDRAFT_15778 [Paxillus rubicundulus Ve08.2h10]|uniref:Uncharacterized protein n=1 Tax=Paxillus rubicundulus Ve08.2h10 TaxID=930991 RepID=A0A0D0DGR3_9AGAM|nr:hypothetical protein PAXRUDRAFT_15778 [Paxillus rubicundulus Ve08.2h10]